MADRPSSILGDAGFRPVGFGCRPVQLKGGKSISFDVCVFGSRCNSGRTELVTWAAPWFCSVAPLRAVISTPRCPPYEPRLESQFARAF